MKTRIPHFTRRRTLKLLSAIVVGGAVSCGDEDVSETEKWRIGSSDVPRFGFGSDADDVRALMDVLLPSESMGGVYSPGANDVGAFSLLQLGRYIPAARNLGVLPALPDVVLQEALDFETDIVAFIAAELNAVQDSAAPLTRFSQLSDSQKIDIVTDGFADTTTFPVYEYVRGVCFLAFLGAMESDAGLVAVGYPPFEDFSAGLAVSGYPRTHAGVFIDLGMDGPDALPASGEYVDYTFNETPPLMMDWIEENLTPGGDLR